MTFTAHTGVSGADYNSYISVEDADAYHTDRANTDWTGTTATKQAALIRATDYIDTVYVFTLDPFEGDIINPALEKATALMALYALSESLTASQSAQAIAEEEGALDGVGMERIKYGGSRDRFPAVSALLGSISTRCTSLYTGRFTQ